MVTLQTTIKELRGRVPLWFHCVLEVPGTNVIHPECAQAAHFLSEIVFALSLAGENEIPKPSEYWDAVWDFQGPRCVSEDGSRAGAARAAFPALPSCSFLPKARLCWEDDPTVRADAGILCEAQRCRNYLMPAKKLPEPRRAGVCREWCGVWDVLNAGSGTSVPAGNGPSPGCGAVTAALSRSLGLVHGAGGV